MRGSLTLSGSVPPELDLKKYHFYFDRSKNEIFYWRPEWQEEKAKANILVDLLTCLRQRNLTASGDLSIDIGPSKLKICVRDNRLYLPAEFQVHNPELTQHAQSSGTELRFFNFTTQQSNATTRSALNEAQIENNDNILNNPDSGFVLSTAESRPNRKK